MLNNVKKIVSSDELGKVHTAFWHKTSLPVPVATRFIDFSMGAGTPKYNAYVGAQGVATALVGSGNEGIYLGPQPPSGETRYINRALVQPSGASFTPANLYLLDYLLFYPLIDGDDTDIQVFDNSVSLPRYSDGKGVRIMLICTTPMTTDANVEIKYTNQDGVSGRTAILNVNGTSAITGFGLSRNGTSQDPFVNLVSGDTGVRSIDSVQLYTPTGGFFCAVLVKPLLNIQTQDTGVSSELFCVCERGASAPEVKNGAYLNWYGQVASTTALTPFRGELTLVTA